MHPFWERDMRKQVPHLQHYVTEPWPQSVSKYKTFQLKYKFKNNQKKPKKNHQTTQGRPGQRMLYATETMYNQLRKYCWK